MTDDCTGKTLQLKTEKYRDIFDKKGHNSLLYISCKVHMGDKFKGNS